MYGMWIPNRKFDYIRIPILRLGLFSTKIHLKNIKGVSKTFTGKCLGESLGESCKQFAKSLGQSWEKSRIVFITWLLPRLFFPSLTTALTTLAHSTFAVPRITVSRRKRGTSPYWSASPFVLSISSSYQTTRRKPSWPHFDDSCHVASFLGISIAIMARILLVPIKSCEGSSKSYFAYNLRIQLFCDYLDMTNVVTNWFLHY